MREGKRGLMLCPSALAQAYPSPLDPVPYDENGEIDMEASRRVEFLFQLKDEEMVREMIEILSQEEASQAQ